MAGFIGMRANILDPVEKSQKSLDKDVGTWDNTRL